MNLNRRLIAGMISVLLTGSITACGVATNANHASPASGTSGSTPVSRTTPDPSAPTVEPYDPTTETPTGIVCDTKDGNASAYLHIELGDKSQVVGTQAWAIRDGDQAKSPGIHMQATPVGGDQLKISWRTDPGYTVAWDDKVWLITRVYKGAFTGVAIKTNGSNTVTFALNQDGRRVQHILLYGDFTKNPDSSIALDWCRNVGKQPTVQN